MKPTKIIAIILFFAMLFVILTGCVDSKQEEDAPPEVSPTVATPNEPTAPLPPTGHEQSDETDSDTAFSTFAPETVMIIAGDYTVTWAELYFRIRNAITNIAANIGEIPDLSEILYEGRSYSDLIMDSAIENALMYRAVEHGAMLSGISLSASDLNALEEDYYNAISLYGGEEGFLEVLWEQDGVYSIDLYHYLVNTSYLASIAFERLYGVEGELLSDDDAEAFSALDGFLMAKHIMRLKTDEDDDTPLNDTKEILRRLDNYSGDFFDEFFDDLMNEYSEDGGLLSNPDGFLFQYGDMVNEFYEACISLDIGDYSDIVETVYGYHIVYRLPVNFDAIPVAHANEGDYRTLRNIAAAGIYDLALYDWMDLLNHSFTGEMNMVDIAAMFGN